MSNLDSYRKKTDAELLYIIKDAGEAAQAMRGVSKSSEAKYLDQVNDASTVMHERRNGKRTAAIELNAATGLEKVKNLYLDYLNAGFKKDIIAKKLKAQFPGAKFTFKGATLYVQFGIDNPPVKVLGTELNAASRLTAALQLHSFKIRTKEDGHGGAYTKRVEAKSKEDAFVLVVKELKASKILAIVEAIEHVGAE